MHWGAKSSDKDKFRDFLSVDTPNSYYISLGDDLNLIPHTDKRFRTTEIDPQFIGQVDEKGEPLTVFDAEVRDYIKMWKKYKIPTERHLGVLEGNHCISQTSNGMNPVQYFCSQTGYPYLAEYSAVVPILFEFYGKKSPIVRELIIVIHHGWGGTNSRQMGADWNKYIQHAKGFDNFDIALYGHTHKFGLLADIVLNCKTRKDYVDQKIILIGICGTFLKTYDKGKESTYSERAGMPPRILSWLEIDIGFRKSGQTTNGNIYFRYPHIVPSL